MEQTITMHPIGIIRTQFINIADMPIQPGGSKGAEGIIEINPEFQKGLADLEGFSHITLIYHFHLVKEYKLSIVPFMDDKPHGIFATRSPVRPNAIGISTVKLNKLENNKLYITDVDMLDGTPLLDIKPFFPKYDNRENVKAGWLEGKGNIDITRIKSDKRFE